MKKLLFIIPLFLLVSDSTDIFAERKESRTRVERRKKNRNKKGIADYFDIQTKANAQDVQVLTNQVQGMREPTVDDLNKIFEQMAASGELQNIQQAFEAELNQLPPEEQQEMMQALSGAIDHLEGKPVMSNAQAVPMVRQEGVELLEDEDEESMDVVIAQAGNKDRGGREEVIGQGINEEDIQMMPAQPTVYRSKISRLDVQQDTSLAEQSINIDTKKEECVKLVKRATDYLIKYGAREAFNAFSHTKKFVEADLYIFAYDKNGVCVAHPQDPSLLWKNLYDMQDSYGRYPIQELLKTGESGGGWVTYEWEGATKVAYAAEVMVGGKAYTIGTDFYSHSKREAVVSLVKAAVSFFNSTIEKGLSPTVAFSAFSYPIGDYVQGDLYTYVISFDGVTMAHGEDPGLIGSNALNVKDSSGQYINRDIIKRLKNSDTGIWVEYISKRAPKKVYAEKLQDKRGNYYFIACGYYPDSDRQAVVDLVRKAYNYMKANGTTAAARAFSDAKNNDFKYGDLSVFVYSMDGVCVAHGNNPALIGKNRIDIVDGDGHHYIQGFIEKAESGGGWVDYRVNKLFRSSYVELIDMGVDKYVIGSGLYPISKRENMILLVKGVINYLQISDTRVILREIVERESRFKRGDLSIFVLSEKGFCLAYGSEYDLIWRNLMNVTDDDGKLFIRDMIETAKSGPSLVKYRLNKREKISYVESVHKDGRNYYVGSGYYL